MITVDAGQELRGVQVRAAMVPTVRVSGKLTGPEGPIAHADIRLVTSDEPVFGDASGQTAATAFSEEDGSFTFLAVAAGDYAVNVQRSNPPRDRVVLSRTGFPALSRSDVVGAALSGHLQPIPIAVGRSDVTGVSLVLRKDAVVRGTMTFDEPMVPPRPFSVAMGASRTLIAPARRVPLLFPNVAPGRYLLDTRLPQMMEARLPQGWSFVSATLDGRNFTGRAIEVGEADIDGLNLTFGQWNTQIVGRVADDRGQPVRDTTLVIFPSDRRDWTFMYGERHIQAARVLQGIFSFADLPAGEYLLASIDEARFGDWPHSELLERLSATAARLSVQAGQHERLVVTTDSGALGGIRSVFHAGFERRPAPIGVVISGTIADEQGRPVEGVEVHAMRFLPPPPSRGGGASQWTPLQPGDITDSQGHYRVERVPPGGTTIIGAALPIPGGRPNPAATARGYAPTFYPGTTSVDDAAKLIIADGEKTGVDFVVQRAASR